MRVGTLEIQLLAGMARLQKDMNDAQRIVGGAMGNVERSVASAKRAMQTLGVGLPIAAIADQVRRMTDQYTKLDAQIRLATKSQAAYAQGMADIRRISSVAQADISATSMLYTRLMNVMDGTGVSQQKLATVTETISFGLKAYGATTQEAASAALQLSQAMGANRLGGEEFRAVMEAMPNVMKVLADSMGVPLGQLRQLSIDGKITADEMVKAFGNPAIAAQFKALAESTQTVTGAWQVARNELMLLVGEFSKSSGLTSSAIAVFNAFGAVFRFMADNIGILTNALLAYAAVLVGKFIVGLVEARVAQMALNAAHVEALAMNVAMARAETQRLALNIEVIASERAKAATELKSAQATMAATAAVGAHSAALRLNAIATAQAAAATANLAALGRAQAASAAQQTAATTALAAAEKAQAASSIGIMGRIKGLAGKAGWIGMALFGAWTVYDFLNGMQQVADGADKLKNKFEGMSLAEVQMARQKELIRQIGMRGMFQDNAAIQNSQDMVKAYDKQIAKMVDLQNAETASQRVKAQTIQFSHDEQVIIARYNELLKQKNDLNLTDAEFAARVADVYGVGAKATKALTREQTALAKSQEELNTQLANGLFQREVYWQSVVDETAAINDKAAQMELEISLIGATAEQEAALTRAKYDEAIATNEQLLSVELLNQGRESDIRAIALHIQALYRLREAAGLKPIVEANQKALEKQQKAHEEMWRSVEGVAHDTWTRIWTEGSNAFQNIGKTIKSAILDMLYQMTVKKWIVGVSMSATGTSAAAAVTDAASGGGGVGSWLNAGQSLWSAFSGGMASGLGGLAVSAGQMLGSTALAEFGAGMTFAGAGGTLAGAAGGSSALSAGTAFGAIAPWLAVGALVLPSLLDAAFGKSKGPSGPTTMRGSFSDQGFGGNAVTPWYQQGGWFSASGGGEYVDPLPKATTTAFSAAVGSTKAAFDALALSMGAATGSLAGWSFAFNRQVNDQESATALINDMANSMGDKLIPELRAFKRDGESLADTAIRMRDTFIATDAILALVGQTFSTVGTASMAMRSNLIGLFGGVEQANAAMQGYYQAFYSENERTIDGWRQMATQLRYLGVNIIPTTNEGFRALVEAQDLNTAAGQTMFATLVGMAPAFDQLTKATATLDQQTNALNDSLGKLSTTGFSTLVDYTRAVQLRQNRAGSVSSAVSGIADAPTLTAIQAQKDAAAAAQAEQDKIAAALKAFSSVKATSDALRDKVRSQMLSDYQQETPTQGYIGWRYPGVAQADITAYWAEYAKKQAAYQAIEALGAPLPAFAVGTNEVPKDMVAQIHRGEEIKPRAFVDAERKERSDTNDLLRELRMELQSIGIAISVPTQKTAKILDRWEGGGMPEVREAA